MEDISSLDKLQQQLQKPADQWGEDGVLAISTWRKHFIDSLLETTVGQQFPIIQKNGIVNVVKDGRLGCALIVGIINRATMLGEDIPTYVDQLPDMLKASGWRLLPGTQPQAFSDVIIWKKQNGHKHAGFYYGENRAVSMQDHPDYPAKQERSLRIHLMDYRPIEAVWTHPDLHG